jgi:hypothetical protein
LARKKAAQGGVVFPIDAPQTERMIDAPVDPEAVKAFLDAISVPLSIAAEQMVSATNELVESVAPVAQEIVNRLSESVQPQAPSGKDCRTAAYALKQGDYVMDYRIESNDNIGCLVTHRSELAEDPANDKFYLIFADSFGYIHQIAVGPYELFVKLTKTPPDDYFKSYPNRLVIESVKGSDDEGYMFGKYDKRGRALSNFPDIKPINRVYYSSEDLARDLGDKLNYIVTIDVPLEDFQPAQKFNPSRY